MKVGLLSKEYTCERILKCLQKLFLVLGRLKNASEHGKTQIFLRIQTSLYRIDGLNPISRVGLDRGNHGLLGPLDDAGFQLLVANSKVF